MIAVPTTTVDILRGQTTDSYGDTVDTNAVWKSGVPASIRERSQRVHGPKVSQDRIVRLFKCRLPNGTGLQKDDRIRDRATGTVYIVDNVYQLTHPAVPPDQAADLSLTT